MNACHSSWSAGPSVSSGMREDDVRVRDDIDQSVEALERLVHVLDMQVQQGSRRVAIQQQANAVEVEEQQPGLVEPRGRRATRAAPCRSPPRGRGHRREAPPERVSSRPPVSSRLTVCQPYCETRPRDAQRSVMPRLTAEWTGDIEEVRRVASARAGAFDSAFARRFAEHFPTLHRAVRRAVRRPRRRPRAARGGHRRGRGILELPARSSSRRATTSARPSRTGTSPTACWAASATSTASRARSPASATASRTSRNWG